ncbi:MAG: response regulator [Candidatus Omnitrophica bacterium]|nr:response regulator [Candidatus Omnitrophota bacterium]MBU4488081.1 response regulator [Candidatus Omnitrophota bacterium]MCG2705682.1 response regulator [Candidatus Omnitrophota bacterium]
MTRILLVDDEWDVCDFMMRFFAERNFEVFTATNGSDAILIAERDKPHIALLDIRMKDMSGIEVLKKIRRINKNLKVVMVTCVSDLEAMKEAKSLGATAYITKPLVLANLMEVVMSNLGRRRNFFNFGRHIS